MLHHHHFYLRRRGLGVIFTAVCAAVILLSAGLLSASRPALAVSSTLTTYQIGAQDELPEIVGSWLVTTTAIKQNVTFPALLTFTGDGILLADEPPALYETTGHGAWAATGKDSADFTFLSLVGSESGTLSAVMKVAGSLAYAAATDTWQGSFTYRVTDADGAEVMVDTGTMDAVRIGVEAPKAAAAASSAMLGPGAKVGEMALSKGPDPFDLNIPPIYAFCNPNPQLPDGSKVGVPGVYTVECSLPPLPQLMIGYGWVTDTKAHLEEQWSNLSTELYLNGKQVDQEAFGSLDAAVPTSGVPGEDPNKVMETPLRTWNVMLENLQAGPLELRFVMNVTKDASDNMTTTPAGIYDVTYKITVDPALAAPEGEPAPVALVPELVSVFDNFNAAVNAHDVDKALSYFADDAVAGFPNNLPEPTSFTGKDELRTWLATDAANNIHVETTGEKTSGDTVTATVTLTEDDLPPDFALVGTAEAVVQDGKIQTFTYTLSDATLEQLKALPQ